MTELTRRRLFQVGTGGIATALAGCSALGGTDDDGEEPNPNSSSDSGSGSDPESVAGEDRTVTVVARADQEAVAEAQREAQESQQEIQEARQAGEISQSEAQERLQELQTEFQETQAQLRREAVEAVTATVEDTSGLTVEESVPKNALLLVSGEAGALIDLLAMSEVAGLLAEARYEEFQQQQP